MQDPTILRRIEQTPRLVAVTYHGMVLQMMALAKIFPRQVIVMTSPSFDGRLLAAFLKLFGVGHVVGSSKSRTVPGSLELIRRIKAGDVGLIAVDGPRGPCCVAKPGFMRIASAARAHLLLTTSSAKRGFTFGSWDRAHLPLPFARVHVSFQILPPPVAIDEDQALPRIQEELLGEARKLDSPILPPMLREPVV